MNLLETAFPKKLMKDRFFAAVGDRREWVIFSLLVALGVGVLGLFFYFYGYLNTWQLWNIPAYELPFLDLRSILSAAQSYAAGYDPALTNPFDPLQRRFNYPKIWYLVLATGINQGWTIPVGAVLIGLFLLGVLLFPGKLHRLSIFFLLLGLFSPAALFGIERGNIDLVFFFLLALGISLVEVSQLGSFLTLLIGILFKIFPLFGAGYFLDRHKGSSLKFVILGILFTAAYMVVEYYNMLTVFKNTLKGPDISYGLAVLPTYAKWLTGEKSVALAQPALYRMDVGLNSLFAQLPLLPYAAAFAILLVLALLGLFGRKEFPASDLRNLRAFWLGAGIYIGTFLLGFNWDYRLVFLLFTLPQLGDWVFQTTGFQRLVVWLSVTALFLAMWYFVLKAIVARYSLAGSYIHPMVDQVIKWALFALLTYLYAASLPKWILESIWALPANLVQWVRGRGAEHTP